MKKSDSATLEQDVPLIMSADIPDAAPVIQLETYPKLFVTEESSRKDRYKNAITMLIIFLINLLNYMDRFTIAGVLEKIQTSFKISDAEGGLLQTLFVCSYMTLAPLFGYLGDRYSRKILIVVGVILWSTTTLGGSFVPNNKFWLFALLRCLVGVGEASYSCVAPTIIADMYTADMRTAMFAFFNIAVPLGSGLGYVAGTYMAEAFGGNWRWSLRFTPALGMVCVILLILLVSEPERGGADRAETLKTSSWFKDVREVCKVKSFILTTLGFTWVAFSLGALSWWGPKCLQLADAIYHNRTTMNATGHNETVMNPNVSLYFGIITCVAGLLGVLLGSEIGRRYRKRNKRGDPIVCGVAVLLSVPFLAVALIYSTSNVIVTWICIFMAETLLCSNWALIADMLMYTIIPTRRSTASAIQIFIMHLLGDASSPYIVGLISNAYQNGSNDIVIRWSSLRNGLMLTPIFSALGGISFLLAAFFILQDRDAAEENIQSTSVSDDLRTKEDDKL